ncbi:hypothetical protein B296_00005941 [Ensete ventricosum]|uniref:Uncharacterized protein n=1 Tax=Ensete ventricosum TaxID=4639 RepID=A0A427AFI0_ENSVE|nr:hypothetical protein B296_00005941 [Ensete ventricosum]
MAVRDHYGKGWQHRAGSDARLKGERDMVAAAKATVVSQREVARRGRKGTTVVGGCVVVGNDVAMLAAAKGEKGDGSGIEPNLVSTRGAGDELVATAMVAEDKAAWLLRSLGEETQEVATVDDKVLQLGIEEEEGMARVEGSDGVVARK